MRIVVVGAGEVGSNIATSLAGSHDVVVIEVDPDTVDALTYGSDILAVEGDGTARSTLREAGIADADLFIASTADDETNLALCGTAKTMGDPFTIGRVRSENFIETWTAEPGAFGVDVMVSPTLLTASDIVRIVGLPAAVDVAPFASGLVQMAEFEVTAGSDLAGETVAAADRFEALTFAALIRDGSVTIPRGETVIEAGDRTLVIGPPESVAAFARTVASPDEAATVEDPVVVGGSEIGYHTAKLFEERGVDPRLIERDPDRARDLAELLPGTVVMAEDATDVDFLVGEGIDEADVLIATTDSDEKNLLLCLLAKNLGVARTVAIVETGEYADLFETVGIDVAINPREATAEEIVRFTQEGRVENLSLVEGRQADVIEIEVEPDSVFAGRPIRESVAEVPADLVVGAITRDREFVVPRGETVIEPGDHVVFFVAADDLPDVMELV